MCAVFVGRLRDSQKMEIKDEHEKYIEQPQHMHTNKLIFQAFLLTKRSTYNKPNTFIKFQRSRPSFDTKILYKLTVSLLFVVWLSYQHHIYMHVYE